MIDSKVVGVGGSKKLPLRRLPLSAGVQPVGKRVMASYQPPAEKVFGWLGI